MEIEYVLDLFPKAISAARSSRSISAVRDRSGLPRVRVWPSWPSRELGACAGCPVAGTTRA